MEYVINPPPFLAPCTRLQGLELMQLMVIRPEAVRVRLKVQGHRLGSVPSGAAGNTVLILDISHGGGWFLGPTVFLVPFSAIATSSSAFSQCP